jgi:alpha-ketoglutarate-dependent taurine dioxygenase
MSLSVSPINGAFAAEAGGLRLSDDHDAAAIIEVNENLLAHSVLVFHDRLMHRTTIQGDVPY